MLQLNHQQRHRYDSYRVYTSAVNYLVDGGALVLNKVALGMDVDARIRCTTYVAPWSSVGAFSKLLLCAFDSVDRDSLWRIMAADGMPPKLLRLIKAYYASI